MKRKSLGIFNGTRPLNNAMSFATLNVMTSPPFMMSGCNSQRAQWHKGIGHRCALRLPQSLYHPCSRGFPPGFVLAAIFFSTTPSPRRTIVWYLSVSRQYSLISSRTPASMFFCYQNASLCDIGKCYEKLHMYDSQQHCS